MRSNCSPQATSLRFCRQPGMSLPRAIRSGRCYLITRRCSERRFFLRPDHATNNAFVACPRSLRLPPGRRLCALPKSTRRAIRPNRAARTMLRQPSPVLGSPSTIEGYDRGAALSRARSALRLPRHLGCHPRRRASLARLATAIDALATSVRGLRGHSDAGRLQIFAGQYVLEEKPRDCWRQRLPV
jgi:hypothetical protein